MKTFRSSEAHAGYGARIWIHQDEPNQFHVGLSKLSKWGGCDLRHYDWMAWEFGAENFTAAIAFLQYAGFKKEGTKTSASEFNIEYARRQFEIMKLHALRWHATATINTGFAAEQALETMKRHISNMSELNDEISSHESSEVTD